MYYIKMSFAYDIRNLKDCEDYRQKRADFFRTLHLQQKLNRNYEQAMMQRSQMEKLGVQPIGEAPRSVEDEKKDLLLQQNLLLKNAIGLMKPEEARKLLFLLNNQEVYDFNTHIKGITEAVKGRSNITADFIRRVFQRYLLVLKSTGGTGVPIPLTEETLAKLPADIIDAWENYARGSIDPTTGSPVDMNDLIRNTAAVLNRTPEDVAQEVKMEVEQEAQTDVPIQQYMKRKRQDIETEARKRARQVQTEAELVQRGLKRVKEEEIFLPQKKIKSEEKKGSLKRRQEEEPQLVEEVIKRARPGPGPDPLPFRRGQKRLARTTLEAELIKRQKLMEVSKKRPAPETKAGPPQKKMKETYLTPQALDIPLEEAFTGYEEPSALQAAKEQAAMAIRRRGAARARQIMAGLPSERKETELQRAKREAREALQARTEARAKELGGGLFISPQVSSYKETHYIQPVGLGGSGFNKQSRCVRMGGRLIGCGLRPQPLYGDRYRQLGKYTIHMPSLKKGMVKIADLSKKHKIPMKMVSDKFVNMMLKFLDEGVLDKTAYNGLDEDEQQHLLRIARLCEIERILGCGVKFSDEEQQDMKKFELLKGTVIAGNNDPEVLKELKQYIFKFIHTGQIDKHSGQSLLCEIACLA